MKTLKCCIRSLLKASLFMHMTPNTNPSHGRACSHGCCFLHRMILVGDTDVQCVSHPNPRQSWYHHYSTQPTYIPSITGRHIGSGSYHMCLDSQVLTCQGKQGCTRPTSAQDTNPACSTIAEGPQQFPKPFVRTREETGAVRMEPHIHARR
jgi:hypothetical protein